MKIKLKKKTARQKQKPTRVVKTSTPPAPIMDAVPAPEPTPTVVFERTKRVQRVFTFKKKEVIRGNLFWAFEEAVRLVGCDQCEAEPGEPCVGKRERPLGTLHIRRLKSYRKHIGPDDYQLRHGGSTIIGAQTFEGGVQ